MIKAWEWEHTLRGSQDRHVPREESKSVFISSDSHRCHSVCMRVCACTVYVCVCRVVNRHFSWSGDGLRRAALISNIIYLLAPCVWHTHTHCHTRAHSDRNSAVYSITHQRSTSFPYPFLPPPPSIPPFSLPWNRCSVLSPNAAICAIFVWRRKKLISQSINFYKLFVAGW